MHFSRSIESVEKRREKKRKKKLEVESEKRKREVEWLEAKKKIKKLEEEIDGIKRKERGENVHGRFKLRSGVKSGEEKSRVRAARFFL